MVFDKRLKYNEILALLGPLSDASPALDSWQWLTGNFDQIVKRMPRNRHQNFPGYASGFCTAEDAEKVQDFFLTRLGFLLRARRKLAQTLV